MVTVSHPVNWGMWTALGTLGLAVGTLLVALATAWSVDVSRRQFKEDRKSNEDHHQQSQRPVVVLMPEWDVGTSNRRKIKNGYINVSRFREVDTDPVLLRITKPICNIGLGPALNVRVEIMPDQDVFTDTEVIDVKPLGATTDNNQTQLTASANLVNPESTGAVMGKLNAGWTIVISYEDVFGTNYKTTHRNEPNNPKTPWATLTTQK